MELNFKTNNSVNQAPIKQPIQEIGIYIDPNVKAMQEKLQGEVTKNEVVFPKELGEVHPFDYKVMEGLYKKFGPITGVVDKYLDFIWGKGFYVKSDDKRAQDIIDTFLKETQFAIVGRAWTKEALIKGPGYLELGEENNKINALKVLDAKYMYVKRDDKGTVEKFNQYIGNYNKFTASKITSFDPKNIIQLNINLVGNEPYGQGIIAPNERTINELIGLRKDMHTLMRRKANAPIHAKLGTPDTPVSPAAVQAFGKSLETLNAKNEFATDSLVDIKVIDFGKVGEKFDFAINHDIDMFIFGTQVPEVLLGRGNIAEGLGAAQMEGFLLRAASFQEEIEKELEEKLFKRVLLSNGIEAHVEFEWGSPSEKETNEKIMKLTSILQLQMISPELRKQVELQLARLLGIEESSMKTIEQQREDELNAPQPQVPGSNRPQEFLNTPFTKTNALEVLKELAEVPDKYDFKVENNEFTFIEKNHICNEKCNHEIKEDLEEWNNKSLKEWLDFNYLEYITHILEAVREDKFKDLAATNRAELKQGYLSAKQIDKLKDTLANGFTDNKSLIEIAGDVKSKVKIKDLLDKDGNIIRSIEARAINIARTETTRIASEGAEKMYKVNGLKQYAWVASLGKRTCPNCEELNGRVFEIGTKAPKPPLHSGCRCTIVGVTE